MDTDAENACGISRLTRIQLFYATLQMDTSTMWSHVGTILSCCFYATLVASVQHSCVFTRWSCVGTSLACCLRATCCVDATSGRCVYVWNESRVGGGGGAGPEPPPCTVTVRLARNFYFFITHSPFRNPCCPPCNPVSFSLQRLTGCARSD